MLKKLLPALLLILSLVFAQSGQQAAMQVAGVTITGNKSISEDVIRLSSGLAVGKIIYGEDIQNSLKKLWGLNLFANIAIESENTVGDKVFLKVVVEEYPRLSKVRVSGNKKFNKEELEPKIKLYRGQTVKPADLQNVINDLREFYKSKNYLLVDFNIKKTYTSENEVDLEVEITEGKKVLIETINFHGNVAFEKSKLLDEFKSTHEDKWWRDGEFNRDKYDSDIELLDKFYKNNGYKDIEILRDSITYNENGEEMYIDIWLSEGQKYYFGNTTFAGNTIFSDEELTANLEFKKGEVFNQEAMEMTIYNKLSTAYMDKGYLRSQIIPEESLIGSDTLAVNFKIVEGNKARIRKINIEGNTRTNEKVIRRELTLYPGDVFSKTKIMRSNNNINMLNYFESVVPDVDKQVNEREVDMIIRLKEKSTEQVNTSVSYSQIDGFVGSIGLTFNNFSFQHPFVQGDGQKLSTNIEFGSKYYRYSLGVEDPWVFDTPTLVGVSGNYQRRAESYSNVFTMSGNFKVGRRFAWSDNWLQGVWNYSIKRDKYEDVSASAPSSFKLYNGKEVISSSITEYFIRDSRDFPEFPTYGSVATLMTKLAGGPLGGDEGFHKHQFEMKWYERIYENRVVLATQCLYGAMDRLNENSYIGDREYFYMGGGGLYGGEPLRGYDENDIGPKDGNYAIGGRNIFKTSVELRVLITEKPMLVYTLAFFDAGNLWSDFKESNLFDLKKGAGIGLRMFVPMLGMMGFDFGYGFDHYDSDGKRLDWRDQLRTHFRMGTNL